MSKYRVYELAKDFDTTSKVILDILARNNMAAKNHMASIEEEAYQVIVRTFAHKPDTAEEIREKQMKKNAAVQPAAPRFETPKPPPQPPKIFYGGGQRPRPVRPERSDRPQDFGPVTQRNSSGTQQNAQQGQPRPDLPVREVSRQVTPVAKVQAPQSDAPQSALSRGSGPVQLPQQAPVVSPKNNSVPTATPVSAPPQNSQPQTQRPQQPFRPANQIRPAGQGPNPSQNSNAGFNRPNPSPRPQQTGQGTASLSRPPVNRPVQGQSRPTQAGAGVQRPFDKKTFGENKPASTGSANGQRPPQRPGQQSGAQRQGGFQRPGQNQGKTGHDSRRSPAGRGQFGDRSAVSAPTVKPEPPKIKSIKMGESISVKDLAQKMGREVNEIIKKLMMLGVMATINQEIDFDTASLIASEMGVTVEALPPEIDPTMIPEQEDEEGTLVHRPPVVTVMGHVDHGKTSLLDVIRKSNVTSREAGGITQHIGAYQVVQHGKKIVFLDTPGHEAFTSMRARGAQVTDIAILVVAADDGVMPQTIEALNHAKSAKVPIIVAINKMDRPNANPDRVKQQLSEHGLITEAWGGDTVMVEVSAHAKTGISDLLEMILLVAEVQDLKANPNRQAMGTVVEAQLDKGRGPVATILVQKGTLRIGDSIIAGTAFGKVRAMTNDKGEKVKKATPSTPVEVIGLSEVPQAGDVMVAVDDKTARSIAEKRVAKNRTDAIAQNQKVTLEDLYKQIQDGSIKDLNILVKADVQGSIEALRQALETMKNKEVRVNIVHSGVGAINESDVMLASASNALIIGFNVRPDTNARKAADSEKIDIRTYRVIYDAINDVEAAMTGMLAPEFKEVALGRVEVRQLINTPKFVVAGSYVLEGKINSTALVRLLRNGVVVYEGKVESLRRFKDDVKEVAAGYECGVSLEKFRDIKEGDIIEAYVMEQIPR